MKKIGKDAIKKAVESNAWKSLQEDGLFVRLSEGNKKLIPTEKVRFLIWNLPAIKTCPYRTAQCEHYCYAIKPERHRPNVRESRQRNLRLAETAGFVLRMIFTIESYLSRPVYKKAKRIVIRIHESGDFYSREYVKKWLEIARYFKGNEKVVFMAYTKSIDFFDGLSVPDNFRIRYSVWEDTKPSQIAKAKRRGYPIYTAVDEFTNEPNRNRCRCDDCATCGKCWSNIEYLACTKH